jgi:phospholipase/carboxylesterase
MTVVRLRKFGDLDARVTGGTDRAGGGDGPVVVLLHGFGAPGDDLLPLGRVLAGARGAPAGTRFVFPEAPVSLGSAYAGGRAWWWIDLEARMRRRAAGETADTESTPEGLAESRAKVQSLLAEVESVLRPPPGKLVLGGFSQGAMLSLDVALHSTLPLAGLVLMSGTRIAGREWAPRFESRRGLPVFMSHGQIDELLPFAVSERLRDTLAEHGMTATWVPFRGGHAIPPPVIEGVGSFLQRTLGAPGA